MKNILESTKEHNKLLKILSTKHNVSIHESIEMLRNLSFSDYQTLLAEATADIIPPSGNKIGGQSSGTISTLQPSSTMSTPASTGVNSTVQKGQTVSVKNANGEDEAGEVTDIDPVSQNITVRDSQGNNVQYKKDDVRMLNPMPRTAAAVKSLMQSEEYDELHRVLELAGLAETASCGATGAGSIASAPASFQPIKKRVTAEVSGTGTIYGKIDPYAATGKLSRRLADKGMNTASRKNNGKKKT